MTELLSCPFCGGEQTTRRHNKYVLLTASNHKRGCIMRELLPFIAFATETEAITAWNTRAEMGYEDALILLDELGLSERTCKMSQYRNALGLIDEYQCSECGSDVEGKPNYCPNCGAKVVE